MAKTGLWFNTRGRRRSKFIIFREDGALSISSDLSLIIDIKVLFII